MRSKHLAGVACAAVILGLGAAAWAAGPASEPWRNPKLTPDQRADLLLNRMSLDEQIALLHGHMPVLMKAVPPGVPRSAGWIPGQPKYGVPAQEESDASLGVANAGRGDKDDATPLPSGLALASTFSPALAFEGGAMIGKEAREKGFNVLLAGGANLARDPRNGRNFEYLGEDPLLGGELDAAAIRGIQSNHIVSTAKHYAVNDQETGRQVLSAQIGEAALRESDLLEFEIAVRGGQPGSIMCSYNRLNGTYACENPFLLTEVLKHDWGYPGYVMSDWGAVHSLASAKAGLDQESGAEIDRQVFFDAPLKAAVKDGEVSAGQVREMAHRVLRSLFAEGVYDHPLAPGGLDTKADSLISQRVAEQGIVLLKNDGGVLPLVANAGKIAVIGGHADVGVISGGGSSQVIPKGSIKIPPPKGAPGWGGGIVFDPSAPLAAMRERAKGDVAYADGSDPAAAAALAKGADVAVVFATQWNSEGVDAPLQLTDNQDALIEAVAAANPYTIVVLETGNPVLMPWLDKVQGVIEAWYPGALGGETIAKVLYGEVDPSGRLPISFPKSEDQLPRPELPGLKNALPEGATTARPEPPFDVQYPEGSDVGYRWYAAKDLRPLFPFGYGLSYTGFRYGGLKVSGGAGLSVSFTVTNMGKRAGIETPQVYLTSEPHRSQQRLVGFARVALKPGESRRVTLAADPRLLASWDEAGHRWKRDAGHYQLFVGKSAEDPALKGEATLSAATMAP
jgi:beta-glucosidase